ncbi:hypothetical protein L3X38_017462 [Prunus dulcis]|uniref:Uncharacterized protein n=1 Tax=Prunus dulcis TaxID=3755 RepID=A0AAD4W9S2_PRUDU|nr:hypothetical protein L3X38_017462 [Prunus dulcis]
MRYEIGSTGTIVLLGERVVLTTLAFDLNALAANGGGGKWPAVMAGGGIQAVVAGGGIPAVVVGGGIPAVVAYDGIPTKMVG